MTNRDPGQLEQFADLPDPRNPRGVRHKLVDVVCISILGVICGASSYSQIQQYGVAQERWLRTSLELPFGIPSEDTFERVFTILNPKAWQTRFLAWTQTLVLPAF